MNRREILLSVLGTAFASGITKVQTLDLDDSAVALVLKYPGHLSTAEFKEIEISLKNILKNTPLENMPLLILHEGMEIELLRLSNEKL